MLKKIIQAFFALILVSFAILQLNDPDPILWTVFYLICALVPALAIFGKPNRLMFWIAATLSVIAMGFYFHGAYTYYQHSNEEALMQSMNPTKPYIEEAREFLGSLIALFLIGVSYYLQKNSRIGK